MPEVWLPYGAAEVPVDIKAENLAEILEPAYPDLGQKSLGEQLSEMEFRGRTLLLVCDIGHPVTEVVKTIVEKALKNGSKPEDLVIMTSKGHHAGLRKAVEDNRIRVDTIGSPSVRLGNADGASVMVPADFAEYRTKVIVSEVGFDPLFGFGGGPVSLLRCIKGELMKEAFVRRSGDLPKPGEDTNPALFASRIAEEIGDMLSVEVLPRGETTPAVFAGKPSDIYAKASSILLESHRKALSEPAKAIIASPGGMENSASLASSLRALFNLSGGLKQKGAITILAECPEGLGSEALRLFVSGRLNITEATKRGEYVEGLESLLYLSGILQEQTLTLVSSLPKYYAESKLGIRTAEKSSDALAAILDYFGQRVKIYIVTKAAVTLLKT